MHTSLPVLAVGQDLGDLRGEDGQVLDLLPQRVDVLDLHEVGVPLDLEHLPLGHLKLLAQVAHGTLDLFVLFLREKEDAKLPTGIKRTSPDSTAVVPTKSSSAFHKAFSRMGRFSSPVRMVVVLMRLTVAVSAKQERFAGLPLMYSISQKLLRLLSPLISPPKKSRKTSKTS